MSISVPTTCACASRSHTCNVCDKQRFLSALPTFPEDVVDVIQSYLTYQVCRPLGLWRSIRESVVLFDQSNPMIIVSTDQHAWAYKFHSENRIYNYITTSYGELFNRHGIIWKRIDFQTALRYTDTSQPLVSPAPSSVPPRHAHPTL